MTIEVPGMRHPAGCRSRPPASCPRRARPARRPDGRARRGQDAGGRDLHPSGCLIPGTSIFIHDVGELARREPATVLVTAWNYAEAIARKHESLSAGGTRFATPLPTPRFVESQRASES